MRISSPPVKKSFSFSEIWRIKDLKEAMTLLNRIRWDCKMAKVVFEIKNRVVLDTRGPQSLIKCDPARPFVVGCRTVDGAAGEKRVIILSRFATKKEAQDHATWLVNSRGTLQA